MKPSTILILLFCITLQAQAQVYSIAGSVKNGDDGTTFPGVTIILESVKDSTMIQGAVTNLDGAFILNNIDPGTYNLKMKFIGYEEIIKPVSIKNQNINIGEFTLNQTTTNLTEVTVTGRRSVSEQRGDTTQFNADAFQTLNDASAQNLVQKMPGISMEDGNIQAQGENVTQILVDGKPFFGTDVKAALQNLPAEVVQSVQVFDKKSDKAELSGFDDGEQQKTINIVTKPDRRKGQFGKTSVGYGTDGRYMAGTSINAFNGDRRITFTGLSNNINAMDFSGDANSQGEARTQDGIITTNSFGINFSDEWGDKIEVSGSYLYNNRKNIGRSSLIRDFVLPENEGQVYTEENQDIQATNYHRFDLRLDYQLDSNNRILFRPRISGRFDTESSSFSGRTMTPDGLLNQTDNQLSAENSEIDITNNLYYSRKFAKKGRSFTLGLNAGNHIDEDDAIREAQNIFFLPTERQEILNQSIVRRRKGFSWEADFSYTEPLGKNGMIEIEYEIGNRLDDSDRLIYNLDDQEEITPTYTILDTALSNTFNSENLSQEVEIGYQYSLEKLKIQVETEFQHVKLQNTQEFPKSFALERIFTSVLPTFRLDYQFTRSNKLEFDFDTYTNAPSIGDLQAVIDNSNPLQLRTGNPELDQSYNKRFRLRYRSNNSETDRSFFVYIQSSFENNRVTNSSFIAQEQIEIEDGIVLEKGSQLSRPVNLDGYQNFRSYISYGLPVDFIKSNLSLNGGVDYTKRPGMVNEEINFIYSTRFRGGFSLSSNISDKVDFNISTRSSYNLVDNSLRPTLNNNYFNQSSRLNLNWILWKGFVYRMDINHQLNTGLAEGFDTSFLLMNMSIGKKLFINQRAEISLNVYDLFGQNNNIRRNISEIYIEDRQSNVLQRYVMLTFTYNLRNFSKGTSMEDF
ncbi:TonB-dependent receptor [Algoriphagus sp. C2-6-M1]|uniref:TonB-dependent receptor n=1 Tax=Algoriphagus persicinus TaxID=3108754 RepID=UPI002B3DD1F5|nr:TonB-dependent receptor [Algoriphagus sp. C2-6-M1]MEB2780541.1 TonB-dependent receptor [Algoriphagus sp. C2-6-M1]